MQVDQFALVDPRIIFESNDDGTYRISLKEFVGRRTAYLIDSKLFEFDEMAWDRQSLIFSKLVIDFLSEHGYTETIRQHEENVPLGKILENLRLSLAHVTLFKLTLI